MQLFKGALGGVVLVVLGTGAWVYSGIYDVSADEPHTRLVGLALTRLKHRSVATRAETIEPPALEGRALVIAGAGHYDAMCKHCHLAPGLSGTDVRADLSPTPPSFREGVAHGHDRT